jgi:uncharacterized phiE125 gp8 family phage protein
MLSIELLGLDSVMLDEAKAYLRLETDEDDAPLGAIILAAINHSERFTGLTLIRRGVKEVITASSGWRQLSALPVTSVTSVTGIPAEGATFVLPADSYGIDIDNNGAGHIRITQPGSAGRVEITYQAGLSPDWASLPESLRLGILRLTGHLYAHRDASDDPGPPTAVLALLRPWRRITLS